MEGEGGKLLFLRVVAESVFYLFLFQCGFFYTHGIDSAQKEAHDTRRQGGGGERGRGMKVGRRKKTNAA